MLAVIIGSQSTGLSQNKNVALRHSSRMSKHYTAVSALQIVPLVFAREAGMRGAEADGAQLGKTELLLLLLQRVAVTGVMGDGLVGGLMTSRLDLTQHGANCLIAPPALRGDHGEEDTEEHQPEGEEHHQKKPRLEMDYVCHLCD